MCADAVLRTSRGSGPSPVWHWPEQQPPWPEEDPGPHATQARGGFVALKAAAEKTEGTCAGGSFQSTRLEASRRSQGASRASGVNSENQHSACYSSPAGF